MAAVKLCQIQEQNSPSIAGGIQVDTAVYVGTGAAGVPSLRYGREAPTYVIEGIQTAVSVDILLDTFNASNGNRFKVMIGTGAFSTSSYVVRSGGTAGSVVARFGGTAVPTLPRGAELVFDGITMNWRGGAN